MASNPMAAQGPLRTSLQVLLEQVVPRGLTVESSLSQKNEPPHLGALLSQLARAAPAAS